MKTTTLILASMAIITWSCQKQIGANGYDRFSSLEDFFEKNQVKTESFTLPGSDGGTITTSRGTKIFFPANAFVAGNNNVNIYVKEILTPAEMILSGRPSMSFGEPLESGGEYFIGASVNNQTVKIAPGKNIVIDLSKVVVKMDSMSVFNGKSLPDSMRGSGNIFTWVINNNTGNVIKKDTFNAYQMFCDSINWINCDRFMSGRKINYFVSKGNCPDTKLSKCFIHFSGRNSVIELSTYDQNQYSGNMVESPATIIGICIKDLQLWASVTTVNLEDGGTATMNFAKVASSHLKEILQSLK